MMSYPMKFNSILFQLAILIFYLQTIIVTYAYAENDFRVESFPRVVQQGQVYLVSASGAGRLKSAYMEFQGVRFPLVFSEGNGTYGSYAGLIGIDMDTRPGLHEIKFMAEAGGNMGRMSVRSWKVEKVDFGTQKLSLPSFMVELDTKTLERVNQETKRLHAVFQGFRDERLWRGGFIRPLEGALSGTFGLSRTINGQRRGRHTGVDLQAEEGFPVLACNSGVVVLVDQLFFSGKSVILDHGWGLYSMYFHLQETQVKERDRINKGAILGQVGSTGRSTRPHLHWGIKMNGARVDPFSLLNIETHPNFEK